MRIADVRSLMPHQVIMFQAGKRALAVGRPIDEVTEAMRTETAAAASGASPAIRAAMVADVEQRYAKGTSSEENPTDVPAVRTSAYRVAGPCMAIRQAEGAASTAHGGR